MLYEPVDEHFLERASEPLVEPRPTLSHTSSVRKPERCHDVTWLTVFALYWVGMLWIGACALQEVDPQRLVQGLDDDDQLCGEPSPPGHPQHHLESLPYVYFACLQYGQRRPTVCVSACPALSGHYVRWYNGTIITCDTHGRTIPATTYPTMHLRSSCVPSTAMLYVLVASIIDVNAFTSVITGMLLAVRELILACVGASLLAVAWMISVRTLVDRGMLAPLTIALAIASLAFLAAALWLRANYLTSAAFSEYLPVLQGSLQVAVNTDMSLTLAILTTAFGVGIAVGLWCGLMERLLLAGGILREAAEAIRVLPSLVVLLPPFLLLLLAALFAYWLSVSVLLASAGDSSHGHMHYDHRLQWFFGYHTIGLLWTAEAILHLGFCASAGVVAEWYFASAEGPPPRNCGAGLGLWRALRYTPGSLAIGALLVIPGRVFRFFLEHCLHQTQTDGRGKPELRGVANCCLLCCLDCSTRYLQYISHNAYIYVSVLDLSFCEGAKQAFELTMRNIGQVAVLTAGERLLLTLVKLAISCTCTGCAALAMSMQSSASSGVWSALDNANGALVLTWIATFCVADAWMAVYDSAVEAIFLCYLVDQEENDGDLRPYYASPSLQRYMERHRPSYQLPTSNPGSRSEDNEQPLDIQESPPKRA